MTPSNKSGVQFYLPRPFYLERSYYVFDSNMSKMLAPATFALAISGINELFWPTPIAAKITENIAMKTLLPYSTIWSWKSIPANQKVNPSTIIIIPLPIPSKNEDLRAF